MRRFALLLFAGVPSVLGAQGFGVYEHSACVMGRAGVTAATPCADGSAIFFNPAGLAGLAGTRASAGLTLISASGDFTDDFLARSTPLDNPIIPVPNAFFTHALSPRLTLGVGAFAPYGLETKWPTDGFDGRFLGYNTVLRAIYVQPTIGYQVKDWLKIGIGAAFVHSSLELHQRVDLATQRLPPPAPAGATFESLGLLRGTDFADATLTASGNGFAVNFGGIIKVSDKLSIGGHWLTKKTIDYDGDAAFTQIATGLTLPPNNPLGLPGGTPVDALVTAQFGAGGALANGAAHTSITLPPQGSIGVTYRIRDNWAIMADYQYVVWGWLASVVVDFDNPATPSLVLTPDGKDTHGFRFGTEYVRSEKLTLRAGYLYHTAALADDFITPLLPEAPRNEFTAGVSYQLSTRLQGDLAYQYLQQNDRRGRVFEAAVGNTGVYKFSAHLLGAGLAFTF
ncbi:MAG: OmpP1/FadL family transporter [Gemmatimonadales bacterium]